MTDSPNTSRNSWACKGHNEKLERLSHSRLSQECAKLIPEQEQAMAEEGLREDLTEWPEY